MPSSIVQLVLAVFLSGYVTSALALPDFLDQWRISYPDSQSADIQCQLCHVRREGGDPWNSYGRDLRNIYAGLDPITREIEQAFALAEALNSDEDEPVISNVEEIMENDQPGWRAGQVNLGYDRNDQVAGVFFPPVTVDPFPQKISEISAPFEIVEIVSGLTAPIGGRTAPVPALANQLFVIDQTGIVWRVNLSTTTMSIFLDVRNRLVTLGAFSPGGYDERGLLGMAFHPDYVTNGLIYLHTSEPTSGTSDFSTLSAGETPNHQGVISELTISNPASASGVADVISSRELLRIDQPQFNHNGGDLLFDSQGYLYISLGDGGGSDDEGAGHGENGNGADPTNPLGSILRIDPLGANLNNGRYGIPPDNPFVTDEGILNEIYAYGFRNPWKMSFDANGDLFVADVGQNDVEEVNMVAKGGHYGWRIKEGSFFFDPNGEYSGIITVEVPDSLPSVNLVDPILEYDHDEGISIIGGYRYEGRRMPSLRGKYIFADFARRLLIGDLESGDVQGIDQDVEIFVYGLIMDAQGEPYFVGNATAGTSGSTGKLFKMNATEIVDDSVCFPVPGELGGIAIICL